MSTIILACTHYPLIRNIIQEYLPPDVELLGQGELVAESLSDYLARHPEIDQKCGKNSERLFLTTGNALNFQKKSSLFLGETIEAETVSVSEAQNAGKL